MPSADVETVLDFIAIDNYRAIKNYKNRAIEKCRAWWFTPAESGKHLTHEPRSRVRILPLPPGARKWQEVKNLKCSIA